VPSDPPLAEEFETQGAPPPMQAPPAEPHVFTDPPGEPQVFNEPPGEPHVFSEPPISEPEPPAPGTAVDHESVPTTWPSAPWQEMPWSPWWNKPSTARHVVPGAYPKRQREVPLEPMLVARASTPLTVQPSADSTTTGKENEEPRNTRARGPYTNWIRNGDLPAIHAAVVRLKSTYQAVQWLRRLGTVGGQNRFKTPTLNTVKNWYAGEDEDKTPILRPDLVPFVTGDRLAGEYRLGVHHGKS
jgi:hypothetical protein